MTQALAHNDLISDTKGAGQPKLPTTILHVNNNIDAGYAAVDDAPAMCRKKNLNDCASLRMITPICILPECYKGVVSDQESFDGIEASMEANATFPVNAPGKPFIRPLADSIK